MTNDRFECKYGYFSDNGREYVITRPDTPKPWVNVIANERYGATISQAGGGFSWLDHSTLGVLTRWEMDLVRDAWGKWLYLKDEETGELWSAAPQPTRAKLDHYECRHGIGYTVITTQAHGIEVEWTITVPTDAAMELWRVRIRNLGVKPRKISVCSHFMWCLGAAPDSKREFHRLFIDSAYEDGLITARKCLWEVPDEKYGHWNTNWPHVAFHAVWQPGAGVPASVAGAGDHQYFLGRHGDFSAPAWLGADERESGGFGRLTDGIAALAATIELAPKEATDLMFALGAVEENGSPREALEPFSDTNAMDRVLADVEKAWAEKLEAVHVETPDPAFNLLNNTWLMYQAIAARLWGRTGYWQQSGAFGFRDQLQDSQVFLPSDPARCLKQLRLHARHQFADGTVYHWWHPLSEVGLRTEMTDDLLWLPFVMISYLKETADFDALDLAEPFVDDDNAVTIWEHGVRAIERVLVRFSDRGLPLIGEGDWNDGLSAAGMHGKGESIWLGHFLYGVLCDWSDLATQRGESERAAEWTARADALRVAINTHGWDGDWYLRATLDDGSPLGSASCKEGRIFLNAQTWSIISGTADEERANQVLDAAEEHLLREYGPLLFTPAYSTPDARVGYLTRYAPAVRENGGVYTHAAIWAIQAACKLGRAETAWSAFSRLAPPNRGRKPDHYAVEPYVTPGNIEGPESPGFGRGGWTWYTGSAAWLRRICLEWILGVRPEYDGLRVAPCLPAEWESAQITRPFRGDLFEITFEGSGSGDWEIEVDGELHDAGQPIAASGEKRVRKVLVRARRPVSPGARQ
ncbi:glycosyl transferase family 36 [bacterium]|nr:glycosyl transferase family 36 [bacterium]